MRKHGKKKTCNIVTLQQDVHLSLKLRDTQLTVWYVKMKSIKSSHLGCCDQRGDNFVSAGCWSGFISLSETGLQLEEQGLSELVFIPRQDSSSPEALLAETLAALNSLQVCVCVCLSDTLCWLCVRLCLSPSIHNVPESPHAQRKVLRNDKVKCGYYHSINAIISDKVSHLLIITQMTTRSADHWAFLRSSTV